MNGSRFVMHGVDPFSREVVTSCKAEVCYVESPSCRKAGLSRRKVGMSCMEVRPSCSKVGLSCRKVRSSCREVGLSCREIGLSCRGVGQCLHWDKKIQVIISGEGWAGRRPLRHAGEKVCH